MPGETPIDISGLKALGITNRRELSAIEAENVRKAIVISLLFLGCARFKA